MARAAPFALAPVPLRRLVARRRAAQVARDLTVDGNPAAPQAILCLGRNLFDKDVHQLAARVRSYRWITLRSSVVGRWQAPFLPPDWQNQTIYARHIGDPAWAPCIRMAEDALRLLQRDHGVVACLDANIDYWQGHAFRVASRSLGLPYLVLSKENPVSRAAIDQYDTDYNGFRFDGAAIACPSQTLHDVFHRLGVAPAADLWTTGFPRLDRYLAIEDPGGLSPGLTLLSFLNGYGVASTQAYFQWLDRLVGRAAALNAGLFVKTKNLGDTADHRRGMVRAAGVSVSNRTAIEDCLCLSRLAIGANSQALMEPLILGLPVLVPGFLVDAAQGWGFFDGIDPDSLAAQQVYLLSSEQHQTELIEQLLRRPVVPQQRRDLVDQRRDLINRFVAFDPGASASGRVKTMIDVVLGR